MRLWLSVFHEAVPLKIGRFDFRRGAVHFHDLTSRPTVDIYLNDVEIEGRNLTNSLKLSRSLFGTIEFNGVLMKSGDLHMTLFSDFLHSPSKCKTDISLSHLDLTDLNPFFHAYGNFDVKKGKFSLYSEAATGEGKIEGYFKPFITDLQVSKFKQDVKHGFLYAGWEKIVGLFGFFVKNHAHDRQAAKIPFSGLIDAARIKNGAALESILNNIFIKPIQPGIDHTVKLRDLKK